MTDHFYADEFGELGWGFGAAIKDKGNEEGKPSTQKPQPQPKPPRAAAEPPLNVIQSWVTNNLDIRDPEKAESAAKAISAAIVKKKPPKTSITKPFRHVKDRERGSQES